MTAIVIVHAFHQAAKMGYSTAAHTGTDKGYVNDWRNAYPGFEYIRSFADNYADQYWFPNEQGSTPFWWGMEPVNRTITYTGGGDGWETFRDKALSLYTSGTLTALASQCTAPTVTVVNTGAQATVTITNNEPGSTIYYTTDGLIPSATSPVYSAPITVKSSRIVRAQVRKSGFYNSRVILRPITITTANEVNVASQGTGYSWNNDYLTADHSNANRIALPGLTDGNTTTDAKLSQDPRTPYVSGDAAYKYAKWQGGGVVWTSPMTNITRFEYVQGSVTGDWWGGHGCYFWNIKLELTFNGTTWVDADKWGYFKEFPFSGFYGSASGAYAFPATQTVPKRQDPIVFFLAQPTTIRGFRIVGGFNVNTGYGQPDYVNVREVRAFQNNTLVTATVAGTSQTAKSGKFTAYPDAVHGRLTVSLPGGDGWNRIVISDLTGRPLQMKKATPGSASVSLDISGMPRGVYVLTMVGNKKVSTTFIR